MPRKTRNASKKTNKNDKNECKATRANKRAAGDGKGGMRKQAKSLNQRYLMGALDTAMTQFNEEAYTSGGLTFVAVNTVNTSTEKDPKSSSDPLNLSMKRNNVNHRSNSGSRSRISHVSANLEDDTFNDLAVRFKSVSTASPGPRQKSVLSTSSDSDNEFIENSQPTSSRASIAKKVPRLRKLSAEFSATAGGQCIRSKSDDKLPPLDAFDEHTLDEWGPNRPRLTIEHPATVDGATADASFQNRNIEMTNGSKRRISESPIHARKDGHVVRTDEASNQGDKCDMETSDDDSSYRSMYLKLLEKYNQKSEAHASLRKKHERQKLIIAELKDLLVFANAETKKAKLDPNAKLTFTTDPHMEMTVQQIEEIDAASKTDVAFGQNLAVFFYGAQKLQTMSVSGVATNRYKNSKPRPGISPKKLAFIHEKVQQRVAARVGANNFAQITTLAHPTRINKGIAEKIANLIKATKYAAARNVLRGAERDVSPTGSDATM